MEILRDTASLGSLRGPVFLAIGTFDGVHRGHQALIAEAQSDAQKCGGVSVVMTFEPHPAAFFQRAGVGVSTHGPLRLSSPRHKALLLERLGVCHLAVLPFDAQRAAQAPEDFVAELTSAARPLGGVCVGEDWRFGRGRSGDVGLLRKLGRSGGFEVDGIRAVRLYGKVISSTGIREAVARGDLDYAAAALGRPYSVLGTVVSGRKLGRELGFPTANIDTDGFQLPPDGVYATDVMVAGRRCRGVANLGVRPTVSTNASRVLEVHILEFDGEICGQELEIEFLRFLRPEKKFPSLDALRGQIASDIALAR